jgi:predicted RNA-binding protein
MHKPPPKGPRYWTAVVRPQNLTYLVVESELNSYAATEGNARVIHAGDQFALYRTSGGQADPGGFVGVFDIVSEPEAGPTTGGLRSYRVRIPCRPIALCLLKPIPMKALVSRLSFIENKARYGAYLQRAWINMSKSDFEVIATAVRSVPSSQEFHEQMEKYKLALLMA